MWSRTRLGEVAPKFPVQEPSPLLVLQIYLGFRHLGVLIHPWTFDSGATAGRLTVKVEPLPASLCTVMSPPIIRANFRLIARPNPVPPYFCCVLASAWLKAWNSLDICSGVIPMPVSVTRKVISEQ